MVRSATFLEQQAAQSWPSADEVASRFAVRAHPNPTSAEEIAERVSAPKFGQSFTDYMAQATWSADKGWHGHEVVPYGPLVLDPAGAVLHYGQEVFEGVKAYRHEDGSMWTFRPGYNAARLNVSNKRLMIPEFPVEDFLGSLVALVRADRQWVPTTPGSSLYLRPFIFGSEAFLGVRAAQDFHYGVIASPAGSYFASGNSAIDVWVEQEHHRAGPGGMGDVKTGGNYAASFAAKAQAKARGFDEVLFLDAATNSHIEELGAMNAFVVMADGRVRTPNLSGTILPGSTRSAILQLLESEGVSVAEEVISLVEICEGIASGDVVEMFACGTAATVVPVQSLTVGEQKITLPQAQLAPQIYQELTDIQYGRVPDRFGWMYQLADRVIK